MSAGYDLQQLVNEDIIAHPQEYGIDEPDILESRKDIVGHYRVSE